MQRETRHVIVLAVDMIVVSILAMLVGYIIINCRNLYSIKSTIDGNNEYMWNVNKAYKYFGNNNENIGVADVIDFISSNEKIYKYAIIDSDRVITNLNKEELRKYTSFNEDGQFKDLSNERVSNISLTMYIDAGYTELNTFNASLYRKYDKLSIDEFEQASLIVFRLN